MPGRGGRNRRKDPHYYWNHVASTQPEAQALAVRLGLEFPESYVGFKSGLVYPIRRLIITGEDTPANLALLLGPLWEIKEGAIVKKTRIEVLLCPPPGSPSHAASQSLDVGSPRWTPRAPNADEQVELAKVRDMQENIARQMQGRQDLDNSDLRQVLMGMGDSWAENLPMLETAVNSTHQNVQS